MFHINTQLIRRFSIAIALTMLAAGARADGAASDRGTPVEVAQVDEIAMIISRDIVPRSRESRKERRAAVCMALVAGAEARGRKRLDIRAVTWAILNRTKSPCFPDDPCAVVLEPGGFQPVRGNLKARLQLAAEAGPKWDPDATLRMSKAPADLQESVMVAYEEATLALAGKTKDPTRGADHFLNPAATRKANGRLPRWATEFEKTITIAPHSFHKSACEAR